MAQSSETKSRRRADRLDILARDSMYMPHCTIATATSEGWFERRNLTLLQYELLAIATGFANEEVTYHGPYNIR